MARPEQNSKWKAHQSPNPESAVPTKVKEIKVQDNPSSETLLVLEPILEDNAESVVDVKQIKKVKKTGE